MQCHPTLAGWKATIALPEHRVEIRSHRVFPTLFEDLVALETTSGPFSPLVVISLDFLCSGHQRLLGSRRGSEAGERREDVQGYHERIHCQWTGWLRHVKREQVFDRK